MARNKFAKVPALGWITTTLLDASPKSLLMERTTTALGSEARKPVACRAMPRRVVGKKTVISQSRIIPSLHTSITQKSMLLPKTEQR